MSLRTAEKKQEYAVESLVLQITFKV